jgi:hypothetical protein
VLLHNRTTKQQGAIINVTYRMTFLNDVVGSVWAHLSINDINHLSFQFALVPVYIIPVRSHPKRFACSACVLARLPCLLASECWPSSPVVSHVFDGWELWVCV